jgi:anhydro-N-acetylmuramic acid kinase
VVNLGGISNVTYIPSGKTEEGVVAFDTGPANMVLDSLVVRLTNGRLSMDRDGKMALRGKADSRLLSKLLAHPFLSQRPPKSTGREQFGVALVEELLAGPQKLSSEDLLATCSAWTAKAVGTARRWIKGPIDEVVVGGGGVRNRAIMAQLSAVFGPTPVTTFDALGWDSKAFEAVAFAVLAYRTAKGHWGNLPAVTGASHPVILGAIVPAGPRWARLFKSN